MFTKKLGHMITGFGRKYKHDILIQKDILMRCVQYVCNHESIWN